MFHISYSIALLHTTGHVALFPRKEKLFCCFNTGCSLLFCYKISCGLSYCLTYMRMRGASTGSWDKSTGLDTTLGVTINKTEFKFSNLGIETGTQGLLGISEHKQSLKHYERFCLSGDVLIPESASQNKLERLLKHGKVAKMSKVLPSQSTEICIIL